MGFPRANMLNEMLPSELAIHRAMQEIEKLPPDERLTEAVTLLQKAKDLVSDFVDKNLVVKEA
jgi:hypothetical protein